MNVNDFTLSRIIYECKPSFLHKNLLIIVFHAVELQVKEKCPLHHFI